MPCNEGERRNRGGRFRIKVVTNYNVDLQGRTTSQTTPDGNVTYTVYNDANHETRIYPGFNGRDDGAIAIDKQALMPGQTATFANYTSYDKGINGIMVDIAGLPAGGTLSASDFTFLVGNDSTPSGWSAAPAPSNIMIRRGDGAAGSDRVEITWADGSIMGEWLQVTIKANANTGLGAPDVFYFGNAPGESGNDPTNTFVDGSDFAAARDSFTSDAPITDHVDFNRDGVVDVRDLVLARSSLLASLPMISAPVDGESA